MIFPPIVPTYQDTQVLIDCGHYNFTCLVSNMQDPDAIKEIHVVMKRQNTNSEMMKQRISFDETSSDISMYITSNFNIDKQSRVINIKIPIKNIKTLLNINEYYKVQFRFNTGSIYNNSKKSYNDWLNENLSAMSDWSRISLFRVISHPSLLLTTNAIDETKCSENKISNEFQVNTFTSIGAKLSFNNSSEKDYLKSYKVTIYKGQHFTSSIPAIISNIPSDEDILEESEIIYCDQYNSYNKIDYTLKNNYNNILDENDSYVILIDILTASGYEAKFWSKVKIIRNSVSTNYSSTLSVSSNHEQGCLDLSLLCSKKDYAGIAKWQIKRTSNKSNFQIWEDLVLLTAVVPENKESIEITYSDYTVESGVFYQYAIQYYTSSMELRGALKLASTEIQMVTLEDLFLVSQGRQLKLPFNIKLSSYKNTFVESSIETIGSKYPYIKRNGSINYRQFSLSGLIASKMDMNFANKESLLKNNVNYYNIYNNNNRIDDEYDFTLEKLYRDEVDNFISANNVLLLRTSTEGNILIKLINISYTPNETLSRMLYEFSADALEVDEFNLQNCILHNVYDNNMNNDAFTIEDNFITTKKVSIILKNQNFTYEDDIINDIILSECYSKLRSKYDLNLYDYNINYIYNLDIQFHSSSSNIELVRLSTKKVLYEGTEDIDHQYGYVVSINNQKVYTKNGKYSLLGDEYKIHNVSFPNWNNANQRKEWLIDSISCNVSLDIKLKSTKEYKVITSTPFVIGQIKTCFESNTDILEEIANRYYVHSNKQYSELLSLEAIRFKTYNTTSPTISVYYKGDSTPHIFSINSTLELKLNELKDVTAIVTPNSPIELIVDYYALIQRGQYNVL